MQVITLPIYSTDGKEVDSVKLNPLVFDDSINTKVIYQAITIYSANQRKGLASTKTRGEVSGGGRKPWKQKGTGRARVGSIRSPLWRHGGVIFGPHPRDFSRELPQRMKNLALRSSLNAKIKEKNFIVIDNFKIESPKTKEIVKIFSNLKIEPKKNSALLLLDKIDKNLRLASRNIVFLRLNLARLTHPYEVLRHKKLIITKEALKELTERLSPVRNTKSITGKTKISNGVK